MFALVLSAAIQAVLIWLSIKLAQPVGVNISAAAWIFGWPIAKIVATLPLSLGGLGVRESSLAALLAPFAKLMTVGRPWVIAKWAMTLDGKLATHTGDSQWISCEESRAVVHQLRGRMDAIVPHAIKVGARTRKISSSLLRPALRLQSISNAVIGRAPFQKGRSSSGGGIGRTTSSTERGQAPREPSRSG
mgnify:CR=1 FL=1